MISFSVLVIALFLSLSKASWPDGQYCLPMPSSKQCPSGWEAGYRGHDSNDEPPNAPCYNKRHGYVPYVFKFCKDLGWGFCCKTRSSNYPAKTFWPSGQYCIFQYGGSCPKGFDSGYIFWDDEDDSNANTISGSRPDGVYDTNTKIQFCCRNDGHSYSPPNCDANYRILRGLPKCSALMLMRYKGRCPALSGYRGPHTGYLEWDTEDSSNRDERVGVFPDGVKSLVTGIKIEFCGYTSYSSC